jgi:competence protein ComGF
VKSLLLKFWNKAFTLLEGLVALMAISGALLLVSGLTKFESRILLELKNASAVDWVRFSNLLDIELAGAKLVKIEGNWLFVEKGNAQEQKVITFGQAKSKSGLDFRKMNVNGLGYQPMLMNVKTVEIFQRDQLVIIEVTLLDGFQGKYFWYAK